MKIETAEERTLILDCQDGTVAFSRGHRAFRLKYLHRNEIADMRTKRYPLLVASAIEAMLGAPNYFLDGGATWDRIHGNERGTTTPLRAVISDCRSLLNQLGCQQDPFWLERGRGYGLNRACVRPVPFWIAQTDGLSINAVAEIRASIDMPKFRWIDDLIAHVKEGRSVRLSVLPGNGADQVHKLLSVSFPNAASVLVDLSTIKSASEFLLNIARNGEIRSEVIHDNAQLSHHRVARIAVGEMQMLLLVIEGWGAFVQLNVASDIKAVASAIHGFKNVNVRPIVVCVLLSPTSIHHLLPPRPGAGSFMTHFEHVFPSPEDKEILESWAHERFANYPVRDRQKLLRAADGQFAAVNRALQVIKRPLHDWIRATKDAHENAGRAILGAVGSCCHEVLLNGPKDSPCLKELKNAGILRVLPNKKIAPYVEGWSVAWGEAWKTK